MDGLPTLTRSETTASSGGESLQRTLKAAISCSGAGLHTGQNVAVRILPAVAGHGIAFKRTDLGSTVQARFDKVTDTRLCTALGDDTCETIHAGTVEHLMAALSGAEIDNALIELDGPELPVFDGSAEPWLFLLDCAGSVAQDTPRPVIEVLRRVRVGAGDCYAELRPHRPGGSRTGLDLAMSIEFDAKAIGRQALSLSLDPLSFRRDIARARTFAQRQEIEALQQAGLARGGSLDNAVVVDGAAILNPAGLRMGDEFIRHKMLDAIGDLALAGGALSGRFIGAKSGHRLNNLLLRALFANAANWRFAAHAETLLAA